MQWSGINYMLRAAGVCAVTLLMVSGAAIGNGSRVMAAQNQPHNPHQPPTGTPGLPTLDQPTMVPAPDGPATPDGSMRARMEADRLKAMNDDRHKRLAADVQRMVDLSNELKTDVDKTTKDELSLEVLRKAGEIEKLAHDVQSRMKN